MSVFLLSQVFLLVEKYLIFNGNHKKPGWHPWVHAKNTSEQEMVVLMDSGTTQILLLPQPEKQLSFQERALQETEQKTKQAAQSFE